ncbi:DNRLRE domain-containing protein [Brevibacillus sp. SYP-B805]|uniref:DNRLRE domain-containing protein n=1 Tax=Brevibacillus sp. SYP-B805 TaxID=1578199 RepID=UPI0013E9B6D4|nr:DNRLRE domain-containing protein [Brevibacillus sp. SYP-B805]NGQ95332.1 DNRLRE domain-containing protein [Brevibacillus sp. SYP-B805]
MFVTKGLVLSLHAALADKGLVKGTNEAPTVKWYDLSKKGNHGILYGFDYVPESGWVGNNSQTDPYSLYFDGTNDYVDCGSADSLKPTASVTFEAWFYYVGGYVVLTSGGHLPNNQGVAIAFNDAGELEIHVKTATREAKFNFGVLSRTTWYHIAGSYDDTTGYLSAYLNGAPQGRVLATSGTFSAPPTNLIIGKNSTDDTKWFRGAVPVVRLYDRALSMDEVGENYLAGYVLYRDVSNLPSRITVPERKDLSSSLKVGIGGYAKGSYRIIPSGVSDITSYILVKKTSDIPGSAYVNPNTSLRARYRTIPSESSDLESSISVTRTNDISGSVSVNPHTNVTAAYRIETLYADDIESSLAVIQGGSLPARLAIPLSSRLIAKYKVQPLSVCDLTSSIEVKGSGNLPGNIKVNITGNLVAKYRLNGIEVADLPSSLGIASVSQLPSTVGVNSHARLRAKYGMITGGSSDLSSSLQITSTSNLPSNIKVSTRNRLVGRYSVVLGGTANLESELRVTATANLDSSLSIPSYAKVTARYNILGIYVGDLPSSFTIREVSDLPSLVRVSPYNSMTVKYDVIEPPVYGVTLYPNKDAFVREAVPRLNYGIEEQMYAGYSGSERFRSFVGFDLDSASIPKTNTTIKKAELKLYFDGLNEPTKSVQVIEPTQDWTEYGITWQNQPFPFGFDSPTSVYDGINIVMDVGGNSRYIAIDVTEAIRKWHEGIKPNFGFIMKALDESENSVVHFLTKEQKSFRPMLEITYYDTHIYSFGRDSILSEITARQSKVADLPSHFYVRSFQGSAELAGNIFANNPRDLFSYMTANRASTVSEMSVRRTAYSDLDGSITASKKDASWLAGSILVNKQIMPSNLYVLYRRDLFSHVAVRRWSKPFPELPTSITVNRADTVGEIGVRVEAFTDWESDVVISRGFMEGSLSVLEKSNLDGELSVRSWQENNLPVEGFVRYHDSLPGSVVIHKDYLPGCMEVVYISEMPSTIAVRVWGESALDSGFEVQSRDNLPSSVYIPPKKDIPSSITVLSQYWAGHITVPFHKNSEIRSYLSVRVKAAADLESENGVRSGWLGSHLAIRVNKWKETPSHIVVRVRDDDDLSGSFTVRAWDKADLYGNIQARKYRESDLYMSCKVRRTEYSEIDGSFTVRQFGESCLFSTISVRVWEKADLPSVLDIRRWDRAQLPATLDIKEHGNLDGHIAVRRDSSFKLPSYIEIWRRSFLDSSITVRRTETSDLSGNTFVRSVSQLPSSISVYQHSNLDGDISVRRNESSALPGCIDVWITRMLDGHIEVRRNGESNLDGHTFVRSVSQMECNIEVLTDYPYAYIL